MSYQESARTDRTEKSDSNWEPSGRPSLNREPYNDGYIQWPTAKGSAFFQGSDPRRTKPKWVNRVYNEGLDRLDRLPRKVTSDNQTAANAIPKTEKQQPVKADISDDWGSQEETVSKSKPEESSWDKFPTKREAKVSAFDRPFGNLEGFEEVTSNGTVAADDTNKTSKTSPPHSDVKKNVNNSPTKSSERKVRGRGESRYATAYQTSSWGSHAHPEEQMDRELQLKKASNSSNWDGPTINNNSSSKRSSAREKLPVPLSAGSPEKEIETETSSEQDFSAMDPMECLGVILPPPSPASEEHNQWTESGHHNANISHKVESHSKINGRHVRNGLPNSEEMQADDMLMDLLGENEAVNIAHTLTAPSVKQTSAALNTGAKNHVKSENECRLSPTSHSKHAVDEKTVQHSPNFVAKDDNKANSDTEVEDTINTLLSESDSSPSKEPGGGLKTQEGSINQLNYPAAEIKPERSLQNMERKGQAQDKATKMLNGPSANGFASGKLKSISNLDRHQQIQILIKDQERSSEHSKQNAKNERHFNCNGTPETTTEQKLPMSASENSYGVQMKAKAMTEVDSTNERKKSQAATVDLKNESITKLASVPKSGSNLSIAESESESLESVLALLTKDQPTDQNHKLTSDYDHSSADTAKIVEPDVLQKLKHTRPDENQFNSGTTVQSLPDVQSLNDTLSILILGDGPQDRKLKTNPANLETKFKGHRDDTKYNCEICGVSAPDPLKFGAHLHSAAHLDKKSEISLVDQGLIE